MATLYERIGGDEAMAAAVNGLYDRIMTDDILLPFFSHLDIEKQIKKQVAFLTMAFGGGRQYEGPDLRTSHAGLVRRGLTDVHFDRVAHHLRATLESLGVEEGIKQEVLGLVSSLRTEVLGR
jgi:hemoglobin